MFESGAVCVHASHSVSVSVSVSVCENMQCRLLSQCGKKIFIHMHCCHPSDSVLIDFEIQ